MPELAGASWGHQVANVVNWNKGAGRNRDPSSGAQYGFRTKRPRELIQESPTLGGQRFLN